MYTALRERNPVAWSAEERAFLVTRYADVTACLRHPALGSAIIPDSLAGLPDLMVETYLDVLHRQLDLMDRPRHTTLRQMLARAFGTTQVERLQTFVRRWMDRRLKTLPSPFDVMTEIEIGRASCRERV